MEPASGAPRSGADLAHTLRRYAALLRESPHNLLSPRGLEELESRHFPESLAFGAGLPAGPRLLDLGSGGGLPGIVIAASRPDLMVHLLDATRKKTDFLTEAASALDLAVGVHHGRAEDLSDGPLAGTFDLVTARAVAPLERLVPWAAPFLKVGGELHAIKGERWAEELAAAEAECKRRGMVVRSTPEGTSPGGREGTPLVVVLQRIR